MSEMEAPEPTDKEIIESLRKRVVLSRERLDEARADASRYNVLRYQEVLIMSPEGPLYLRLEDLDAYIDELRGTVGIVAQEVAQVVPQAVVVKP